MPHRQEGGCIAAGVDRHPQVGKLDMFAVVRAHRNDFGAVITCLDGEMGIRRARGRQAGAGDDDVGGVVPIGRFRHVGLFAPGLRGGCRQVAVPVVKRTADTTDQGKIARTGCVRNLRHRRDRREAENTIRAPFFDGVNIGGGNDFVDFVPFGADKTAEPAYADV